MKNATNKASTKTNKSTSIKPVQASEALALANAAPASTTETFKAVDSTTVETKDVGDLNQVIEAAPIVQKEVETAPVIEAAPAAAPVAEQKAVIQGAAAVSKAQVANAIFKEMFGRSQVPARKDMIKAAMSQAGLTEKGAATYLQNYKSKNGLVKKTTTTA